MNIKTLPKKKKIILIVSIILCSLIILSGIGTGIYFAVSIIPCTGQVLVSGTNQGLANVSVTDGKNVVKTDSNGVFKLKGWHKAKFVTVSIPSGYWTEDYYIPINRDTKSYNFTLDVVEEDMTNHSFLQVTDTEIGEGGADSGWINELKNTAKEQNSAFIVHTGDICYEAGLKQHIKDMNSENMGVPVRYVIGNHDYINYGGYGEALFEELYGPVWYSFEVGNIHYVVTPIGKGDYRNRYSKAESYRWLANDLANTDPNKKVVIFNHDSCPDENGFVLKYGLNKLDMKEHGLLAWVFGHLHYNYVNEVNGILNITSAPPQAGIDSSIGGFRTISIEDNKISNSTFNYIYFDNGISEDGYKWQTKVSGRNLYAEPLVVDNKVYIATNDDNYPRFPVIACLDAKTGEELWSFTPKNSIKNNFAISDNILLAQDTQGIVYGINVSTGQKIWEKDLQLEWYQVSSQGIVIDNGKVYCGNSMYINCLDIKNGNTIWRNNFKKGENSPNRMVIAGDKLLVGGNWRGLFAFDKNTGKHKWTSKEDGFNFTCTTPLVSDNKVIMTSNNSIFEINLDNGKLIRSKNYEGYDFYTASQPILDENTLYVTSSNNGVLKIDYSTLDIIWNFKTGKNLVNAAPYSLNGEGDVQGSVLFLGDSLVFGATDGYIYSIDKNGVLLDKYNIGSPILSKVTSYDGNIIIADFSGNITSIKYDGKNFIRE